MMLILLDLTIPIRKKIPPNVKSETKSYYIKLRTSSAIFSLKKDFLLNVKKNSIEE